MNYSDLARESVDLTLEVREEAGIPFGTPVNVYDLCERLDPRVRVRFSDYSMEGCYHRSERPLIEISALRPLGRRVFNTAHELGHHALGHPGMRLDEQIAEGMADRNAGPEEYAANTFAAYLLMPKIGVRRAFSIRGWVANQASPEQIFTIACHFGVGYTTLINHLAYGLREITQLRATELSRVRLPAIRRALVGTTGSERLWIADRFYFLPTLDTEVGTGVLLPIGSHPEFAHILAPAGEVCGGWLFTAARPGITRVEANEWAATIRVARYQYSGWSTNRHLEPDEEDDD